jgi:hypothetical protein
MVEGKDTIENQRQLKTEEAERLFKPEKVCFVSAIDYPGWLPGGEESESVVRGVLTLNTVRNFLELGVNVVLVHSQRTSRPFLDSVRLYGDETLPHEVKDKKGVLRVVEEKKASLGEARRQGILEALNIPEVEVVFMTESEKVSFSERKNLIALAGPILAGKADMVIPDRGIRINLKKKNPEEVEKEEDLRGYYPYQAYSEVRFNTLVHDRVLVPEELRSKDEGVFDLIGGTRVFNKNLAPLFLIKWEVRKGKEGVFDSPGGVLPSVEPSVYLSYYAPVILALSLGKKVISVPVSYQHPQEQTRFEAGSVHYSKKRWAQLHGILPELAEVTRFVKEIRRNGADLQEVLTGKVPVGELELSSKVRLVPKITVS